MKFRAAFTLIELLVVIAIIAVLTSLMSSAVVKSLEAGTRLRTTVEIRQLDAACVAFKTRFGDYPPSYVRLRKNGAYDLRLDAGGQPIDKRDFMSYQTLVTLWPRLKFPVNWNGDPNSRFDSVWELEGDQCLVYFLGGIPHGGTVRACMGFSTDPQNPAGSGSERIQPFFEFDNNRLRELSGNGFYSYLDPYGEQPYAYFSGWGRTPGYADVTKQRTGPYRTDCPRLGVWPYAEIPPSTTTSNVRIWHRPISFQVLSAGKDGQWGIGTRLTDPSPAYWSYNQVGAYISRFPAASDDFSNFHDLTLGVSQ